MQTVRIKDLSSHIGEKVIVNGWLYNKRTSGKLQFPIVRDGSGYLQCVVFRKEVSEETWNAVDGVTQESTIRVIGTVRAEQRAPGGVELGVETFEVTGPAKDYPITPKEHGTAFLMDLRHLWLRSSQQHAILRVRNEIEKACRDFFYDRDFVLIDSPILTAAISTPKKRTPSSVCSFSSTLRRSSFSARHPAFDGSTIHAHSSFGQSQNFSLLVFINYRCPGMVKPYGSVL